MIGSFSQIATVWKKSTRDKYSKYSYNPPITFYCRWEDNKQLTIDQMGQEAISVASIYCSDDVDLALDDVLYLGNSVSDTPVEGSYNIISINKSPSITGTFVLQEVKV